jgi:hypothetical protein
LKDKVKKPIATGMPRIEQQGKRRKLDIVIQSNSAYGKIECGLLQHWRITTWNSEVFDAASGKTICIQDAVEPHTVKYPAAAQGLLARSLLSLSQRLPVLGLGHKQIATFPPEFKLTLLPS